MAASSSTTVAGSSSSDSDQVTKLIQKSRVEFKSGTDAVVFACHQALLSRGFVCVGLEENGDSVKDVGGSPNGWNASSDVYTFRYTHPRLPKAIVMKCLVMDSNVLVHVINKADGKMYNTQFAVKDYVEDSVSGKSAEAVYRNIGGIVSLFHAQIGDFVTPKEESNKATENKQSSSLLEEPRRGNRQDPYGADPYRDPSFDPAFGMPQGLPHPGMRGDFDRDLDPFGGAGFGGGLGGGLGPLGGGGPGMGGGLMGPGHPAFGGRGRGRAGRGGPGSMMPRRDPFGPGPGFGGPDHDHLPPPGRGPPDMFG